MKQRLNVCSFLKEAPVDEDEGMCSGHLGPFL